MQYGLILAHVEVPAPEVKTTYVDVPFGNGAIDYTDYFGEVKYKNREIQMNFICIAPWDEHDRMNSMLNREVHGKHMKISFSNDQEFYWLGRVMVESWNYEEGKAVVVINAIVEPYKYKLRPTIVTRQISGSGTVFLKNLQKSVCPLITSTDTMTFVYNNKSVVHNAGEEWRLADLVFGSEGASVNITGTGTVTFEYQEGSL